MIRPIPEGVTDKDALIRELVKKWRKAADDIFNGPYDEYDVPEGNAYISCADELEAELARTTCPEAFGGCKTD